MDNTKSRPDRVWARTGFDLEGVIGAAACLLVGLLLGALWSPLFWLGFLAAIVCLLATRRQSRTAPDTVNLAVAPCDGVIESIERAAPPLELRMGSEDCVRIRIASSPFSQNPLYAPIAGEIVSLIAEEPNASVIIASEPDLAGLAVAYVGFGSLGQAVGCMFATGGFGPRLEMLSEVGDAVRVGRTIGKRRLGGWCDIYLPSESRPLVRAGQSLIGAETVLCRLKREADATETDQTVSADVSGDNVADSTDDNPDERAAKLFQKLKEEGSSDE